MITKSRIKKIEEKLKIEEIDPKLVSRAFNWLMKKGFKKMPKELEEVFKKKPLIEWLKDAIS